MTTSTPNSTSKSSGDCRCNKDCGCCEERAARKAAEQTPAAKPPGFFGKRPWLFVIGAFLILITAWSILFVLAYQNQPEQVPMVQRH